MRGKLYLSVAFATLAICLSQGYAQTSPGGASPGENRPGASETRRTPGAATKGQKTEAGRDQRAGEHSRNRAGKRDKTEANAADKAGKAAARDDDKQTKAERDAAKTQRDATKTEREADKAQRDAGKAERDAAKTDAQRRATDDDRNGQRDRTERRRDAEQDRDATGRSITGQDTTRPGADATRTGQDRSRTTPDLRTGQDRSRTAPDMETGQDTTRTAPDMRTGQDRTRPGRDLRTGQDTIHGRDATRGDAYGYAGQDRARLDRNQQSRVRDLLGNQRNVRSYSRTDVNVRVGAVIPPNVNFYPLPGQIASIVPQYSGYSFFRVDDEFVIVDPGTRQIVSVIDNDMGPGGATYGYGYGEEDGGVYGPGREGFREGGREEGFRSGRRNEGYRSAQRDEGAGRRGQRTRGDVYGYAAPRLRLDEREERALYRGVMREARSSLQQVCVRVGERVPESVELEPVPRQIAAEAPEVRRFDYFVLNDQVVLVDPDTRIVADIIERPR